MTEEEKEGSSAVYHVVSTVQEPTVVVDAIVCNFINAKTNNIAISRGTCLEVYEILDNAKVNLVIKTPIYGNIIKLESLKVFNNGSEWIVALTDCGKHFILGFNEERFSIETVAQLYDKSSDSYPYASAFDSAADHLLVWSCPSKSYQFLTGIETRKGMLRFTVGKDLFPTEERHKNSSGHEFSRSKIESFNIDIDELHMIESAVIPKKKNPSFAILYADSIGRVNLKTYSLSLKTRLLSAGSLVATKLDRTSSIICPVEASFGFEGIFVAGCDGLSFFFEKENKVLEEKYPMEVGGFSSLGKYFEEDKNQHRLLLGDDWGTLHCFGIRARGDEIKWIYERIGETSRGSVICQINKDHLFVGSASADSQVLQLAVDSSSKRTISLLKQQLMNLGPIADFEILDSSRRSYVLCSGSNQDGSLRITRNGIPVDTQTFEALGEDHTSCEVVEIKDQSFLLLSTTGQSVLLSRGKDEISFSIVEFENWQEIFSQQPCQEFLRLGDDVVCGRANNEVHFWDAQHKSHIGQLSKQTSYQPGKPIERITTVGDYIIISHDDSTRFVKFSERDQTFTDLNFKIDRSILLISAETDSFGKPIVAVFSLQEPAIDIFSVEDHKLLGSVFLDVNFDQAFFTDSFFTLNGPDSPISEILLVSQDSATFLFIGKANGSFEIIKLNLKGTFGYTKIAKYTTGDSPTEFRKSDYNGKTVIYVSSGAENLAIVHYRNGRFLSTNLFFADDIGFGAKSLAPCENGLFILSKSKISLLMVADFGKRYVKTVPLAEQPSKICSVGGENTNLFCVLTSKFSPYQNNLDSVGAHDDDLHVCEQQFVKLFDSSSWSEVSKYQLTEFEMGMSICPLKLNSDSPTEVSLVVVGTGFAIVGEQDAKEGRILVFKVKDSVIELVAEHKVQGAVYSMTKASFPNLRDLPSNQVDFIGTVNGSVILFNISKQNETDFEIRRVCEHHAHVSLMDVKQEGQYVLIGELMRSVSVLYLAKEKDVLMFKSDVRDYEDEWTLKVDFGGRNQESMMSGSMYGHLNCYLRVHVGSPAQQKILKHGGHYNLGSIVSTFRAVKQLNSNSSSEPHQSRFKELFGIKLQAVPQTDFCTASGTIGIVSEIDKNTYWFLSTVADCIDELDLGIGGLSNKDFRRVNSNADALDSRQRFIDGDYISTILDFPAELLQELVEKLNKRMKHKGSSATRTFNLGAKRRKGITEDEFEISTQQLLQIAEQILPNR